MKFNYDREVDVFSIKFDESPYAESDEVKEGVILDYDKAGKIIGIEILDAAKQLSSSFHASILRSEIPLELGA